MEISDLNFSEVMEKVRRFLNSSKQHYIVTPNPEFVIEAQKDKDFRVIINQADISVPDGIGLKFASLLFGKKIKERITGVDLTWKICKLAEKEGKSVLFLGGEDKDSASKAVQKIKAKYEKLNISSEQGEIFKTGDKEKEKRMVKIVNKVKPDILFVALGAPKQEKFISQYLSKMPSVKLAIGVGGTFDYISGIAKLAPKIIRKIGMEWLYRLIAQPWRRKRIYTAVIRFPLLAVKWRFRMWCCYRRNAVGLIVNKDGEV